MIKTWTSHYSLDELFEMLRSDMEMNADPDTDDQLVLTSIDLLDEIKARIIDNGTLLWYSI
jgi:hypothetical protein